MSDEKIISANSSDKKISCSFCGKSQEEVKKLIAGPNVYICNECVVLCKDILVEDDKIDTKKYHSVILTVAHKEYLELDLKSLLVNEGILYDVKGVLPLHTIDARL